MKQFQENKKAIHPLLIEVGDFLLDIVKDFLYSEMSIEELYKEVLFFINSDEIQKGEFEGNQYILRKIDKENFILYAEYEDKEGRIKEMSGTAQFIHKDKLIETIEKYIKENEKF